MFNKINSIISRKIVSNFTNIEELINYIKSKNRTEFNDIIKARTAGKGSEVYDDIKKYKIPCVLINFNYREYVNSNTIIKPTGYLYIDIDNEDTLGEIDTTYIVAFWRSLSNNGFTVIVKVENLNQEHLKETYKLICNQLDLRYDSRAVSKDRVTVLSYDPEVYYNPEAKEIQIDIDNSIEKSTHYSIRNNNLLSKGYDCNGNKIHYDNLPAVIDLVKNQISYDEEGIFDFGSNNKLKYAKLYIPNKTIKEGERNNFISTITHQLIAINKSVDEAILLNFITIINNDRVDPSLDTEELLDIFNKKYQKKEKLTPIFNAERRFIYDPDRLFSSKEKRKITIKRINIDRIKKSKEKISKVLINWDYKNKGKITIKKIVEITKMNIKTVSKYYRGLINDLKISNT